MIGCKPICGQKLSELIFKEIKKEFNDSLKKLKKKCDDSLKKFRIAKFAIKILQNKNNEQNVFKRKKRRG